MNWLKSLKYVYLGYKKDTKTQDYAMSAHRPFLLLIVILFPTLVMPDSGDRILLDEVAAVVKWEETAVFAKSDVERSNLFGQKVELKDLINQELVYQDAVHHKVTIDEEVIDKYLGNIQRQNKFTQEQMQGVYEAAGITERDARHQLRIMYANSMMMDHKITSRLIIPEKEVIAYYEANPITKQAKYKISTAFIPFDSAKTKEQQKRDIEQQIRVGKSSFVTWRSAFWLKADEIAEDKDFITRMNVGDIKVQQIADGFMLYKLDEKKPEKVVPLHKRYRDIQEELRKPRLEELMSSYTDSLFTAASVIYFNQK